MVVNWTDPSSLNLSTVVIVASNMQLKSRRTEEDKDTKDAAAARLQHIHAGSNTATDMRKTLCVSMDSLRERGEEDERETE